MIAVLFGLLVGAFSHGTYSYEECKANDFKPEKACVFAKNMNKLEGK